MTKSGDDFLPPVGPLEPDALDGRPAVSVPPGFPLPHDVLQLERARFANPSVFFLVLVSITILFITFGLCFLYSGEWAPGAFTLIVGLTMVVYLLIKAWRSERDVSRSGIQYTVNWRSLAKALTLIACALAANLLIPYNRLSGLAAISAWGITAIFFIIGVFWAVVALRD